MWYKHKHTHTCTHTQIHTYIHTYLVSKLFFPLPPIISPPPGDSLDSQGKLYPRCPLVYYYPHRGGGGDWDARNCCLVLLWRVRGKGEGEGGEGGWEMVMMNMVRHIDDGSDGDERL